MRGERIISNATFLQRIAAIEFILLAALLWLIGSQSVELHSITRLGHPTVQHDTPRPQNLTPNYVGSDYRLLWENAELTNVNDISTNYPILGNEEVDAYIRQQGEKRGYRRQPVASGALVVREGYAMQAQTARAWDQLKKHAASQGVGLTISSGQRGSEEQATLFRQFLRANVGFLPSAAALVNGEVDDALDQTLARVAPTGYSKHHSGYTLDLCDSYTNACATRFEGSNAEAWISANNYANARRYGFIPSYPADLKDQGPNPEPWEIVWVGTDTLDIENYAQIWQRKTN